jgi:four helix bundle protein
VATAIRFEDLEVWQESRRLVFDLYQALQHSRDYGFRDQIQRAVISIMNNIAEGFERGSDADFARFVKIAKASCGEVRSMLYVAQDLDYFDSRRAEEFRKTTLKISSQLGSLLKYLNSCIK